MDIAIVTGAETPLGLRIVETLNRQGCRVHGIGNNFSKVAYADIQYKAHAIDLTDLEAVASTMGEIIDQEQRIDLLVHAIDVTPGAAFEKLPVGNLEAILKVGLLGPVIMTRLAMPNLLRFRGQLINVITSNKYGHPASAANALIEGGLREMNQALFDQARDSGLRVTNCILRQNMEFSKVSVSDATLRQSRIDPESVVHTIEQLLDAKSGNVPAEIVLYPRLSPEAEQALPEAALPPDPYSAVVLPPKAYCPPEEPKIPTQEKRQTERSIPYTDEEMEDKIAAAIEDFEAHPERYEQPDKQTRQKRGTNDSPKGEGAKSKRRRRRGGRNRNKNKSESSDQQPQDANKRPDNEKQQSQGSNQGNPKNGEQNSNDGAQQPGMDGKKPTSSRRKSEPKDKELIDQTPGKDSSAEQKPKNESVIEAKPETTPVKKRAKKAAKKKASKTATGSTPRKTAAKKTAKKKTAGKKVTKNAR